MQELQTVREANARESLTIGGGLRVTGIKGLDDALGGIADRVLGLRELNRRYHAVPHAEDAEAFARIALDDLDIEWEVAPSELEHIPVSGPAVVVANHPFGGIEGLLFADIILRRRKDLRILANVHLQRIRELRELIIAVNPFEGERATRENVQPLRDAVDWVRQGGALMIFPSGEVSHFQFRRSSVTDPEWRPSAGYIVRRTGAPVIPAFVFGRNTLFFQLLGCIHPRLRTAMLAREFLNKERRRIRIRFGPPVTPSRSKTFSSSLQRARFLRLRSYSLSDLDDSARGAPTLRLAGTDRSPAPAPIIDAVDPGLLESEFDALRIAHLPDQPLEQELPIEVALIHGEQRLLGGARQVGGEGASALLHLRLERLALVLGGDEGEARTRHDEERDH